MPRENIVAVIDKGGRGAVLASKYLQSPDVDRIIAIPGNDMMAQGKEKPVETYPMLRTTDVNEIADLCRSRNVALADVSSSKAVRAGLADALRANGVATVGPGMRAGEIEWSKAFAREFGKRHMIPQPEFYIAVGIPPAMRYVDTRAFRPLFIKADGLMGGSGSIGALTIEEARIAIKKLGGTKSPLHKKVVIEEWLTGDGMITGEEFSAFAMSDGRDVQLLGFAQDYNKAESGERGSNTGGMGASTPHSAITPAIEEYTTILFDRAIRCLKKEGRKYNGVLYMGGMLVHKDGELRLYVLEWNARWGEPEAQVVVPGIIDDYFRLNMGVARGEITSHRIANDGKARVAVTAAARGYPEDYSKAIGKEIVGLDRAAKVDGVTIFGAGVKIENGRYYANGGRLFYVVAEDWNTNGARERAYAAMSEIQVEDNNLHFRDDIGMPHMDRILRH